MTQANKLAEARLTIEHINKFLHVNIESGILTWKPVSANDLPSKSDFAAKTRNLRFEGKTAGSICSVNGYVNVYLIDRLYRAHRVIWFFAYGYWPEFIDHINGNRADNRISNLRNVSNSDNSKNTKIRSNNKTGKMGVGFRVETQKYRARIKAEGRTVNLGEFDKLEDAVKARDAAEEKYKYHKNHGRKGSSGLEIS